MGSPVFYYRVGDFRLLLETEVRAELLTQDSVYPVPFAPPWCSGLMGLRGELYPVVDMHRVLLNQPRPDKHRLLWMQHPSMEPVIITCDGMPTQIKLPEDADSDTVRPVGLPGWVGKALTIENALYLAADHVRLLKNLNRLAA